MIEALNIATAPWATWWARFCAASVCAVRGYGYRLAYRRCALERFVLAKWLRERIRAEKFRGKRSIPSMQYSSYLDALSSPSRQLTIISSCRLDASAGERLLGLRCVQSNQSKDCTTRRGTFGAVPLEGRTG